MGFLSLDTQDSQDSSGRGRGSGAILTSLHRFHPLQEHLDISLKITAESSPLPIASDPTRTGTFDF